MCDVSKAQATLCIVPDSPRALPWLMFLQQPLCRAVSCSCPSVPKPGCWTRLCSAGASGFITLLVSTGTGR